MAIFRNSPYFHNSNGNCGVFGHAQLEETDPEQFRQGTTTGNDNIDVLGPSLQFLVGP